jgi:hypothetical protein
MEYPRKENFKCLFVAWGEGIQLRTATVAILFALLSVVLCISHVGDPDYREQSLTVLLSVSVCWKAGKCVVYEHFLIYGKFRRQCK